MALVLPHSDRNSEDQLRTRRAIQRLNPTLDDLQNQITNITNIIGGLSAESFVSTLAADGGPFVSNGQVYSVPWTKDLHFNSAFYAHSQANKPEEVTVVKDGVYQVEFDVLHTLKDSLDFWLEIFAGGAYRKVSYSDLKFVATDINGGGWTGNMSVGVPMIAGTKLRVRGKSRGNQGDPGNLKKSGTRLALIREATVSNGGTGHAAGWDATPPTWTEVAP